MQNPDCFQMTLSIKKCVKFQNGDFLSGIPLINKLGICFLEYNMWLLHNILLIILCRAR